MTRSYDSSNSIVRSLPDFTIDNQLKRGRVSTSSSPANNGSLAMNVNRRMSNASSTRAGGPKGLRNAETQTFVSTTTRGTARLSDFLAGGGDVGLDLLWRDAWWDTALNTI